MFSPLFIKLISWNTIWYWSIVMRFFYYFGLFLALRIRILKLILRLDLVPDAVTIYDDDIHTHKKNWQFHLFYLLIHQYFSISNFQFFQSLCLTTMCVSFAFYFSNTVNFINRYRSVLLRRFFSIFFISRQSGKIKIFRSSFLYFFFI